MGDWMRRLANARIRSEIRRRRWEREHMIHIEQDVPETSPAKEAALLGDELLHFYSPRGPQGRGRRPGSGRSGAWGHPGRPAARAPAVRGFGAGRATTTLAAVLVLRHVKGLTSGRVARVSMCPSWRSSYGGACARLPSATSAQEWLQSRCGEEEEFGACRQHREGRSRSLPGRRVPLSSPVARRGRVRSSC